MHLFLKLYLYCSYLLSELREDPDPEDFSELLEVPDDLLLLPELLPELLTAGFCEERCTPEDWCDSDLLLWLADCEDEDCREGLAVEVLSRVFVVADCREELVAAGCRCVAVPVDCLDVPAASGLLVVPEPVVCLDVEAEDCLPVLVLDDCLGEATCEPALLSEEAPVLLPDVAALRSGCVW